VLVYFAACALAGAMTEIDPYDGAHHTVLAWNLASTGQYARETYGHLEVWPVEITVGPTLIVPMALGFRIAGWGPFILRDNAQNVVFRNRYFAIYRLAPPVPGGTQEQRAP